MSHPDDYVHMVPEPKYQAFLALEARIEELYGLLAGRDEEFYALQRDYDKLQRDCDELCDEEVRTWGIVCYTEDMLKAANTIAQGQQLMNDALRLKISELEFANTKDSDFYIGD
jgi:hypothetical protein